jgi:23S rRNA (guanine745-N1)-methyltransferase
VLSRVTRYLACPHCGGDLTLDGARGPLRCPAGHTHDVARHGYAGLLRGDARPGTADTADMVTARDAFLRAGHYRPLTEALAARAADVTPADLPGCVVDVGAGTGHHLAAVLDALPGRDGLALDISAYALRRAARAHPRAGAARCDAWRTLPVRPGAAALALNVFAPRDGAALHRVLTPGGHLVVVTPTPDHLRELVEPLGLLKVDEAKAERVEAKLDPWFTTVSRATCAFTLTLDHPTAATLAGMGPSGHHIAPDELAARAAALLPSPAEVTASVVLTTLAPRP